MRTPNGQFAFQINGKNSAVLAVVRGRTYTFDVATSANHPFRINAPGAPGPTTSGQLSWTLPLAETNYTYDCTVHTTTMQGQILTVAPVEPAPEIRLLTLSVGEQLVLRSTGTNTWTVEPEYSTNLAGTNWTALTVNSNRFNGGTNETFCGVPPGTNVFVRVRSMMK